MMTNSVTTPRLKPLSAFLTTAFYPLSFDTEVIIGREPGCEIVLDSNVVAKASRRHCAIRPIAQTKTFEVCDLNSANGTYVNGKRLHGCQVLRSGDRIRLAADGAEFQFEDPSVPAVPATVIDPVPHQERTNAAPATVLGVNQSPPLRQIDHAPANPASSNQTTLKWVGGIVGAIVVLGMLGNVTQRSTPVSNRPIASPASPTAAPASPATDGSPTAGSPTAPASNTQFSGPIACQPTSDHICTDDASTFDGNASGIQFNAVVKNAPVGSEITMIIRYVGSDGKSAEKALPPLGNVQTTEDRVWATLRRPAQGWVPGNYQLIVAVAGSAAQKDFAIAN